MEYAGFYDTVVRFPTTWTKKALSLWMLKFCSFQQFLYQQNILPWIYLLLMYNMLIQTIHQFQRKNISFHTPSITVPTYWCMCMHHGFAAGLAQNCSISKCKINLLKKLRDTIHHSHSWRFVKHDTPICWLLKDYNM